LKAFKFAANIAEDPKRGGEKQTIFWGVCWEEGRDEKLLHGRREARKVDE